LEPISGFYAPQQMASHNNSIIEDHAKLDHEDFEPQSPTSNIPKWKRNTRNVLQYRKSIGDIRWNRETEEYLLPM
jgi:hypothetical protein